MHQGFVEHDLFRYATANALEDIAAANTSNDAPRAIAFLVETGQQKK